MSKKFIDIGAEVYVDADIRSLRTNKRAADDGVSYE
jgi:hypothetical protein